MAKEKIKIDPIKGWLLVSREELASGELGGWYIAWESPFETKSKALSFAKRHGWPQPYLATRGQISVTQ